MNRLHLVAASSRTVAIYALTDAHESNLLVFSVKGREPGSSPEAGSLNLLTTFHYGS